MTVSLLFLLIAKKNYCSFLIQLLFNLISITFQDREADCIGLLNEVNSLTERIWPFIFQIEGFLGISDISLSSVSVIYCWSIYGHIESDHVLHTFNEV